MLNIGFTFIKKVAAPLDLDNLHPTHSEHTQMPNNIYSYEYYLSLGTYFNFILQGEKTAYNSTTATFNFGKLKNTALFHYTRTTDIDASFNS